MKFYNYLIEGRTQSITSTMVNKLIQTDFKDAFKAYSTNKTKIYRNVKKFYDNYGYVDPSKSTRKSANTSNHYTLMMDNLPEWKAFPKRSKSVICITNLEFRYIVLPKNGAKIAVCPNSDIWVSFGNIFLISLNYILSDLYKIEDKNFNTMKKQMENISINNIRSKGEKLGYAPLIKLLNYVTNEKNLFELVKKFLNPFEFKIAKIGDFIPTNNEVWTDSPCLLIRKDKI
jgi:hypothetical protein